MKTTILLAVGTLSVWVGNAGAQAVTSSSQASGSGNTSVSAGRSGANAQSDANANAAGQTQVTAPEHQRDSREARETKEAKKTKSRPSGRSTDQKDGSTDAAGSLATGTTVHAILSKPIDSAKAKPGDRVDATAAQDVKSNGEVAIHRGSHLVGHVTEAKHKEKGETSSSLGIVFDHAVLKDGQQVPMNSVVQALAAAQTTSATSFGDDSFGALDSGSLAGGGAVAGRGTEARGGLLGGATSTVGGATGSVAGVGGGATGAVNSTLGSTAHAGGGLQGALTSSTSGVIGLKDLSLASSAANATQGSVITSTGKNVHLDSGTQMVLRVVGQ